MRVSLSGFVLARTAYNRPARSGHQVVLNRVGRRDPGSSTLRTFQPSSAFAASLGTRALDVCDEAHRHTV